MAELPALVRAGLAVGIPLLALVLVGWSRRWRGPATGPLVLAALGGAAAVGVASPLELPELLGWTGLTLPVATVLAWSVFSVSAGLALRRLPPGPPVLVALVLGAALGELGAALVLGRLAPAGAGRARLVLAAAAGGLAVRVGDPGALLLAVEDPLLLGALGLLAGLLALPRSADLPDAARGEGSLLPLFLAGAVSVAVLVLPALALPVLGLGALALLAVGRPRPDAELLGPLAWVLGSALLVLLATAGGLPEAAATGLEEVQELGGRWSRALLALLALLLALLLDGPAAGLFADATLRSALELRLEDPGLALALGLGLGGLGPLVLGGCLRAGWWRLGLQALAVLGLLALLG